MIEQILCGDAIEILRGMPDESVQCCVTSPPDPYFAGILDGEGYVGIKRSTYGMRRRTDVKSPTFSERVQIRMSDYQVLALFKKRFGGALTEEKKVYQSQSGFKSGKKMWCYRASDRVAAKLIRVLLPYLIVKREQAILCLELRASKDSKEARTRGGPTQKRPMSNAVLNKREELCSRIKEIHGH